MRLNSSRASRILRFIYLICFFIVLFDILIINIDGSWSSLIKLSPFAVLTMMVVLYRGLPQFQYDSDGEVLNFTVSEPNLKFLGGRFTKHVEFPKRKLQSFKINNFPLRRRLILYIRSKDNHLVRQAMSISYLKTKEVKDLRRSLERVTAINAKRQNARRERSA